MKQFKSSQPIIKGVVFSICYVMLYYFMYKTIGFELTVLMGITQILITKK